MKNKKIIALICSLAVVVGLLSVLSVSQSVNAMEGQVSTGGKILFYEGSTPPEETLQPESEGKAPPSAPDSKKPAGSFPSTGELIGSMGFLAGFLFLLIVLLKRRRERES